MGKLLIDGEPPLIVQASLALKIGFNEAMVLQQVHYWMQHSTTTAYGHRWVYNTMEEWNAQFPFWSKDTVRRTIASLKERGLLVAECLSNNRFDRTPYYRISAETLESIVGCKLQSTADTVDGNLQSSTAQNAIDVDANLPSSDDCNLQCSDDGNLQSTLDSTETTKDYSETTAPGPEVVVVENSVAPQAASASNGIQVGLFSAEPAKPEPGQVALALPAAEPADDGDGDAPDDRPAGVSDDEWKIFDYWRDKTGHTRAKLGPKRVKVIKAALKMGYEPFDLCRAIQGCVLTPYNQGDNERDQKYDDLGLILRDEDHIDRYARNAKTPPRPQPKNRAQERGDSLDAAAAEFLAMRAERRGAVAPAADCYVPPNDGMTIDMGT